jgi:threonine/homoserine/homoserine lactone efflux protein
MKLIPQVQAATAIKPPISGDLEKWIVNGEIQWPAIVKFVASTLFFLAAVLCLIFLIWGGISIISSGGDKGKVENARNRMTFAAIGLVIVAASYALWYLVLGLLGVESLSFG